jgi:hypothetical protein
VAVMGEETSIVNIGASKQFLGELLSTTATPQVNSHAVISALALPVALQTVSSTNEPHRSLAATEQHLSKLAAEARGASTRQSTKDKGIET